jgi:hypothetical protein
MNAERPDRIRHPELIVLLGELTARSQTAVESTPSVGPDNSGRSHDRSEQQLATLLSRHRAGRKSRRTTRLVEEILEAKTDTNRCLWLVPPLAFPVRAEPTLVRHEIAGVTQRKGDCVRTDIDERRLGVLCSKRSDRRADDRSCHRGAKRELFLFISLHPQIWRLGERLVHAEQSALGRARGVCHERRQFQRPRGAGCVADRRFRRGGPASR